MRTGSRYEIADAIQYRREGELTQINAAQTFLCYSASAENEAQGVARFMYEVCTSVVQTGSGLCKGERNAESRPLFFRSLFHGWCYRPFGAADNRYGNRH